MHRFQRGGRGGGPRPGPNPAGPGAPGKEWTFGLTSYANGTATPVPLVSARADAKVLNYGAEVSFTQTYRNNGATAIDATYVFPVPFQGTVTGVEASIDGVNIVGHVRDRQSAPKERPEDPNNLPVIMYVTEQDRLYLQLKAVLPHIPAGKTVQFKITYVTEIAMDEDRLRLNVPLKFTTTKRPPKPDAGVPAQPLERDQAQLDLHVSLDMPDAISAVETNGASIFHLSGQPHQAAISLAPKNFVPYDFAVFTKLANPRNNRVSIEAHPNGSRLAILDLFVPGLQNFHPDSKAAKEAPKEAPKEAVKEAPKEAVKEAPKEVAKEDGKDKEKDEKEPTTPAAPAPTEAPKEDAAAPVAPPAAAGKGAQPAKYTKKRFSASDLSIECSDKSLTFVALPVSPAVTRGRVTLFVPLPADFASATVSIGPKDAPGVVQLQIDASARHFNATVGHTLYARAHIRELEGELDARPAEARADEIRKTVVGISTKFGVASSLTQIVTYEKAGAEEKEIAPLARKRPPPIKPAKEVAPAAPAAATAAPSSTPEEKKGDAAGDKKGKREKPAAKPSARPTDGPASPVTAPAAAGKPAAVDAHGQQRGAQQPGRQQGGQQQHQQQRPPREAPKTQELEATTLFRSISRLQNNFGAWTINRNFADVICIDFGDLQGAIRTNTTPGVARVWATALAVAFIDLGGFEKDPSERNAVRDVLQRARKWMTETVPGKEAEWLDKAKAFIGEHIELVDA